MDQPSTGKLLSEPQSDSDELTVQVALCARFDRSELNVETIRYFDDDDAIVDPFDEEVVLHSLRSYLSAGVVGAPSVGLLFARAFSIML